jgi:hypothetical protein
VSGAKAGREIIRRKTGLEVDAVREIIAETKRGLLSDASSLEVCSLWKVSSL